MLVPTEDEAAPGLKAERQGAMAAVAKELAQDSRCFRKLSPDERSARIEKVMGIGRGLVD